MLILHVCIIPDGLNLLHTGVMAQVDHFAAGALQDAAHDVDGRVVAVEQAAGGDDADFVGGGIGGNGIHIYL